MAKIISVHSFRGGTGKSNITANLAVTIAQQGYRVGIVDTDIQSPGIHVLFGFDEKLLNKTLNDYLWGAASIDEVAYPLHETTNPEQAFLQDLKIWLIPSSIRTEEITRIVQEGYNVSVLYQGLHSLMISLRLDYLFIDTHPGVNEETLVAIAVSHGLILIMRPDQQDFQGTAVTVDIARQLEVPQIGIVINKVLSRHDPDHLKADIAAVYDVPVVGLLPLSEDVAANASSNIFSMLYPDDTWSISIREIAENIMRFEASYQHHQFQNQ